MNAITAQVGEAAAVLREVWSGSNGATALVAWKWFYSEVGAEAFIDFAVRMETAPHPLVREIFRLRCEIAARRAGWCPELPAQPFHAE